MKTTVMAKSETVDRKWYVVDATDIPLGRVASQVAAVLRGKNKPIYTPHVDTGDHVIVINSDKLVLTGNKLETKNYYNHSQFSGGLRTRSAKTMIQNYPVEMFCGLYSTKLFADEVENLEFKTGVIRSAEVINITPDFVVLYAPGTKSESYVSIEEFKDKIDAICAREGYPKNSVKLTNSIIIYLPCYFF